MLKWGISLKQLVVLQMFVGVFLPWDRWKPSPRVLLAPVIAVVKLVLGVLAIALFEKQHGAFAFLRHFTRDLGRFWVCVFVARLLAGGVI